MQRDASTKVLAQQTEATRDSILELAAGYMESADMESTKDLEDLENASNKEGHAQGANLSAVVEGCSGTGTRPSQEIAIEAIAKLEIEAKWDNVNRVLCWEREGELGQQLGPWAVMGDPAAAETQEAVEDAQS